MKAAGFGFTIGLLTFAIGLAGVNLAVDQNMMLNFLIEFPNATTRTPSIPAFPIPSEEIQAEVIVASLANISRNDHNVADEGRIYLYVSKSIFARLPRKIKGIRLELLSEPSKANELRVAATTFSNWQHRDGNVNVTITSYFYGGNTGGCDLKFSKIEQRWKRIDSSCFAAAS